MIPNTTYFLPSLSIEISSTIRGKTVFIFILTSFSTCESAEPTFSDTGMDVTVELEGKRGGRHKCGRSNSSESLVILQTLGKCPRLPPPSTLHIHIGWLAQLLP